MSQGLEPLAPGDIGIRELAPASVGSYDGMAEGKGHFYKGKR